MHCCIMGIACISYCFQDYAEYNIAVFIPQFIKDYQNNIYFIVAASALSSLLAILTFSSYVYS